MFSFQAYPGNLLNTYHWRAVDADHVVVWRGWYSIDGMESETLRQLVVLDRETTVEEVIHLVKSVQRGLTSRGFRPGLLVMDPADGVNSEQSIAVLRSWMRYATDRLGKTAAGQKPQKILVLFGNRHVALNGQAACAGLSDLLACVRDHLRPIL